MATMLMRWRCLLCHLFRGDIQLRPIDPCRKRALGPSAGKAFSCKPSGTVGHAVEPRIARTKATAARGAEEDYRFTAKVVELQKSADDFSATHQTRWDSLETQCHTRSCSLRYRRWCGKRRYHAFQPCRG